MRTKTQTQTKVKPHLTGTDRKNYNTWWRGFFQGYATAEKDAINRGLDRVAYVVANIRLMIEREQTDAELLNFLDKIKVKDA